MRNIDPVQLLKSPEGQKLLQLMQKDGGAALRKAAAAAKNGDHAAVKASLEPLLQGTDAQSLAEKLFTQHG